MSRRANAPPFSHRAAAGQLLTRRAVASPPRAGGDPAHVKASDAPILIIGGGVAALYAALMLLDVGIPRDKIHLFEASDLEPTRIGGSRLFTYRFSNETWDYYDVGAMRYPQIPWMQRVFDLFKRLNMGHLLLPYHISSENTRLYYNGKHWYGSDPQKGDVFNVSVKNDGVVPDRYVFGVPPGTFSPDGYWFGRALDDLRAPFAELNKYDPNSAEFRRAFEDAWDILMTKDKYSTREYMRSEKKYPEPVIDWLETFLSATGLFDMALTETVLDDLDFDWPSATRGGGPEAKKADDDATGDKWWCIKGGSAEIQAYLRGTTGVTYYPRRRVTRITVPDKTTGEMKVTWTDDKGIVQESGPYSQVISTVSLGCLQAIDTHELELSYQQNAAIRSCEYDDSTKIGLRFPTRWWQHLERPIFGGSSSTDLPIRTVVYPSYGIEDADAPGVLLASYTWAQDASRLASIARGGHNPINLDDPVIQLTLDNLAAVHGISREQMGNPTEAFSWGWYNDSLTRGAFALFGPGEFSQQGEKGGQSFLASLKAPNHLGTFHIAGEATSVHHAWVLGSLNSAWRAVYNLLTTRNEPDKIARLIELYGVPDEEDVETLKKLHDHARHRRM